MLIRLDRVRQVLVKLVLELEWEVKFEVNLFGFRLGRSIKDVIREIYSDINKVSYYVLDVYIEKCFGGIYYRKLLDKFNIYLGMC